jgi:hypothetical protein
VESQFWFDIRLERFEYKNLVGPLVDDYTATVLREPLEITLRKPDGGQRPKPADFYTDNFWPDPTGAKKGDINWLARQILGAAMVKKQAWVIVSTPDNNPGYQYTSLAEQEKAGDLRVTVNEVPTEQVYDAGFDQHGLAWVKLRKRFPSNDPLEELPEGQKPTEMVQWTLYTRKTVRGWQKKVEQGKPLDLKETAEEIGASTATHKFADAYDDLGACPVQRLDLNATLWMADRISLVVLAELRKRNSLSWYEDLTCFPQMVHSGDDNLIGTAVDGESKNTKRGSQYVWEIEKDGKIDYLEPSGASLEHNSDRLDQMEKDVYKGVQQVAAAQGPGAAAAIQSAASKVRDNVAKTILCALYAHETRTFIQELHYLASVARSEKDDWTVGGAGRYDIEDQEGAINSALLTQGVTWIPLVPTLHKALMKKTSRALLPDASTATHDDIEGEIDALKIEVDDGGDETDGGKPKDKDDNPKDDKNKES